jgi:nucleotide-binding universal stress UspA family protein
MDCERERGAEGWRQIAVVVEDPEMALMALQNAVAVSRRHGARLTIISVTPRPWPMMGLAGICPLRLEAEATAYAAAVVRRLAATLPPDVPCTTVVRSGRAAREIVAILRERCCDLVFFAPRPGGGLWWSGYRKTARVMRTSGIDCVHLGLSSTTPAETGSRVIAANASRIPATPRLSEGRMSAEPRGVQSR